MMASHHPVAARAVPSARERCLKGRACPARIRPCRALLHGSARYAENCDGIFPSEGGSLPTKEPLFRALLNQGFEGWPVKGSTAAPDQQSQGQPGHTHTKPRPRTFEMPYVVFEAGQRRLVQGIPSRESIDPLDPIERVRALPSEPLRALYGTCLQTTSRPSPNGARMFTRTTH